MNTHWARPMLLLLTALLAGCAQDSPESLRQQVPVTFTLEIGKAGTRTSTVENVWPNGTLISISNGVNTYQYRTSSDSGEKDGGEPVIISPKDDYNIFYWPIDDPTWSFEAWYPYDRSVGSDGIPTSGSVKADQRLEKDGGISEDDYLIQDLLYCPPTTALFWQNVSLVFYHQLARVIVIVNTDNTEQKETVTGITLGLSGDGNNQMGLSGTFETTVPGNGTTTWKATSTGVIQMRDRTERTDKKSANNIYTYECMVIPGKYDRDKGLIGISTTGAKDDSGNLIAGDLTYTYSDIYNSENSFLAGYQYTFNLVVSSRGVVNVSSLQVIDWSTESIPDLTADVPTAGY